jgi:hypothetical protein
MIASRIRIPGFSQSFLSEYLDIWVAFQGQFRKMIQGLTGTRSGYAKSVASEGEHDSEKAKRELENPKSAKRHVTTTGTQSMTEEKAPNKGSLHADFRN